MGSIKIMKPLFHFPLTSPVDKSQQHQKKFPGMPKIKPTATGWEATMLPLFFEAPFSFFLWFKHSKIYSLLLFASTSINTCFENKCSRTFLGKTFESRWKNNFDGSGDILSSWAWSFCWVCWQFGTDTKLSSEQSTVEIEAWPGLTDMWVDCWWLAQLDKHFL